MDRASARAGSSREEEEERSMPITTARFSPGEARAPGYEEFEPAGGSTDKSAFEIPIRSC